MSRPILYRRRATRRAGGAFEITERDIELLALISLAGYISAAQVAREFFPSFDRCRRRLRQLFDGRLITVTLASSTKPNLISLTRPGLALVLKQRPELNGRAYRAGAIRLAGVDHHLAVVDARLYAAGLGEVKGLPLVQWSNAGGTLPRDLGLSAWQLAPDGVAQYGRSFIGIEVDLNSEPRATIASKLDRYVGAIGAGLLGALWFVVRAGPERLEGITALVSERGLSASVRVIDHALVCARPVVDVGALDGAVMNKEGDR